VANVKVLGDGQVELTGEREGRTALLAWKAGGERVEVRVTVGHPAAGTPAALPERQAQEQPAPVDTGHCGAPTGAAKHALETARRHLVAKDFAAAKRAYLEAIGASGWSGPATSSLPTRWQPTGGTRCWTCR
jgi:hypothetical protein